MNDEDKLYSDVGKLAKSILELEKSALPIYKEFAEDVIYERIIDIKQIEWQLDFMVSYCFDVEILSLYKAILRKLFSKHPDTVQFYVQQYFDMFGNESDNSELKSS